MSHLSLVRRGLVSLAAAAALLVAPAAAAERPGPPPSLAPANAEDVDGTMSPIARAAMEGYLVPDPQAHAAAKAGAAQATQDPGEAAEQTVVEALAPSNDRGWAGLRDPNSAPSDSTGAVGTSRYVELVNRRYAIYNRSSNTPITEGTLAELSGLPGVNAFDPQVIWDPTTRRFYYAMDAVFSSSDNRIAFGWSTTASPDDASDFCHYTILYGSVLPDYPKLGDTRHFMTFGVNSFTNSGYVGSDVLAIGKPPSGPSCPSVGTLPFSFVLDLKDNKGVRVFTPVGVNQTDTAPVGWFVARSLNLPASYLAVSRVSRDGGSGVPVFQNPARRMRVGRYTVPANAPQQGSAKTLDTLDARPTQAVSAIDPANGGQLGIWTQHTVNGAGGRAEVRWYEIEPFGRTVLQSDEISTPRFNYNAAISPDRAVAGPNVSGGDAMVVGYTSSSTSSVPKLRMVSKIGVAAQSGEVVVKSSPGPYAGFDCAGADNDCRWGDYAAASPDPKPPAGTNRVWSTNTFATGGTSTSEANWRAFNWIATP